MEYTEAISRISEIHEHLAKGEVYRGFRSAPMAISGLLGLSAAIVRPVVFSSAEPGSILVYWIVVAAICAIIGGSETAYYYLFVDDEFGRRRTRKVLSQFVPCLAAGGAITFGLARRDPSLIEYLPALWAIVFSLGVFAARPYLPRSIGWVALYYAITGCALLIGIDRCGGYFDIEIGGAFGIGQLAAALVFYWNLERTEHA